MNSLDIYEAKLCNSEEAQDIRKFTFTYLKKCSLFTFINIIFKGKKKNIKQPFSVRKFDKVLFIQIEK